MPITQSRLHLLTRAAGELELAYDGLRGLIERYASEIRSGTITPAEAIAELALNVSIEPSAIARARETIHLEGLRYRLTHARNTRDRERKQRSRLNYPSAEAPPSPRPRTAAEVAAEADAAETATAGPALEQTNSPGLSTEFTLSPDDRKRIEAEAEEFLSRDGNGGRDG